MKRLNLNPGMLFFMHNIIVFLIASYGKSKKVYLVFFLPFIIGIYFSRFSKITQRFIAKITSAIGKPDGAENK